MWYILYGDVMNCLVTGGSRGIGKSTILKFASEGYNVVINYNNSQKDALELEQYIKNNYHVDVICIKCDVSQEDEVKAMFKVIKDKFNTLDVLVNNAGIAQDEPLEDKNSKSFLEVLKVNLLGTFLVSKYALEVMSKGIIINIASNNAYGGIIESCDYDASKAGVIALSHDFAKFLAPNIRVNVVAPGWINTDMNKDLFAEFKKAEEEKIFLKRFGNAEDIASTVFFLANNNYINDAVIKVDGGYGK